VKPAFAFGHGLSFTNFKYSKLTVAQDAITVTVTNAGKVAGREVAQLYLKYPAAAGEPPLVLRGFEVLKLEPGAQGVARFKLEKKDVSIWDVTVMMMLALCYSHCCSHCCSC